MQNKDLLSCLTPKEIVDYLDKYVVGQRDAKECVAVALRNRDRRMQVYQEDQEMGNEITPKNILMIGPTGVGKTEIARRLAKLANAPFIKIEATKFTEVGYVGRDVESIIRDLVDIAVKMTRETALTKVKDRAATAAEERILNYLLPGINAQTDDNADIDKITDKADNANPTNSSTKSNAAREMLRHKLINGELDDKEIELDIAHTSIGVEIMAPPGMEEMTQQLQSMFQNLSGERFKKRKLKIKDALKIVREEEASKLINDEDIKLQAIERAEQAGIVFLDEIDKITQRSERHDSGDVSRGGVQRDLLPLLEGSTVSTKYGMIKTDHILFIASGAFHLSKPSDLIPELQGRLPIRVELSALSSDDFVRILTEPNASLIKQYQALLKTEGVVIDFTADGIKKISEISYDINENTENIGARRLHTVVERLLKEISFNATDYKGQTFIIDAKYVEKQLSNLAKDEDLSRFIL